MRLKILIVPSSLVVTLIILIGFIKPDFTEIQAKKADIVVKEDHIANVNSVIEHIATLNNSLSANQASEDFLLQHLPPTMEQEKIISTFNYLASQSGLIITAMDLKKAPEIIEETSVTAPDGSVVEISLAPKAKTFQFTGSVYGSYKNIKAFFTNVTHINRFRKIQSFSLQKDDQLDPSASITSDLEGTIVVDFGYFPFKPVPSALDASVASIFSKSELNFSDITTLQKRMTSTTPSIEKGLLGKPDPFQ